MVYVTLIILISLLYQVYVTLTSRVYPAEKVPPAQPLLVCPQWTFHRWFKSWSKSSFVIRIIHGYRSFPLCIIVQLVNYPKLGIQTQKCGDGEGEGEGMNSTLHCLRRAPFKQRCYKLSVRPTLQLRCGKGCAPGKVDFAARALFARVHIGKHASGIIKVSTLLREKYS